MKFIATGRVHPERAEVNISQFFESNEVASIRMYVGASQIVIHIDDPRIECVRSAHTISEHYAQAMVSSLGLANGCGYTAEITQILDYEFGVQVIGVGEEELASEEHDMVFNNALRLTFRDPFFRFALLDYTSAITDKLGCANSCFRVFESLAKAIDGSKRDKYNWEQFHLALGTDKATIDRLVKNFADPVRHGNWVELADMTWDNRAEMLVFTKDVLIRYIAYALDKLQSEAS